MVENCEFDRYNITCSTLNSLPSALDLCSKVKRPRRIGSWSVQDCSNIVLQHHCCKEPDVDVSRQLENILILPASRLTTAWPNDQLRTHSFCFSTLKVSQSRYFPSSLIDNSDSAILLWFRENMIRTATTPGGIIMILSDAIESGYIVPLW